MYFNSVKENTIMTGHFAREVMAQVSVMNKG